MPDPSCTQITCHGALRCEASMLGFRSSCRSRIPGEDLELQSVADCADMNEEQAHLNEEHNGKSTGRKSVSELSASEIGRDWKSGRTLPVEVVDTPSSGGGGDTELHEIQGEKRLVAEAGALAIVIIVR